MHKFTGVNAKFQQPALRNLSPVVVIEGWGGGGLVGKARMQICFPTLLRTAATEVGVDGTPTSLYTKSGILCTGWKPD